MNNQRLLNAALDDLRGLNRKPKQMSKHKNKIELVVAGILIRDGAVLLGRKCDGICKGRYVLPGGHVEFKESLEAALVREFKEEVGLDVICTKYPCATWEWRSHSWHRVILFYNLESDPLQRARPGSDIDFTSWMTRKAMENAKVANLLGDSTIAMMEADKLV